MDHPPLKFLISISGSKFRIPSICDVAYKELIKAKSVHFIGEKDWLRLPSEDLAKAFQNPLIIRHSQGHTVPRLGTSSLFPHIRRNIIQNRIVILTIYNDSNAKALISAVLCYFHITDRPDFVKSVNLMNFGSKVKSSTK